MKALNLGNRFYFGNLTLDVDLMARTYVFEDHSFTAILAPSYQFGEWGRLFAKVGYETGSTLFYGGGFEYFPLKENKNIRLHAAYTHNDYTVGDMFSIGLTWKMNLTKFLKPERK